MSFVNLVFLEHNSIPKLNKRRKVIKSLDNPKRLLQVKAY